MALQRIFPRVLLLMIVLGLLSSCAYDPEAVTGIVSQSEPLRPGTKPSGLVVTTPEGYQRPFILLREPIAIVTFLTVDADQCCWLNPRLVSLADEIRLKPITVAQISMTKGQCEHGSDCKIACHLTDPHLVSLCDVQGFAAKAYHHPKPGTVFLVNRLDKVDTVGDLSNLDPIIRRATKLAEDLEISKTVFTGTDIQLVVPDDQPHSDRYPEKQFMRFKRHKLTTIP